MANINITEASSSVVIDNRMWAGSDPSSTAWLQSPIGSNSAEGGLNLLVIDLIITAASTATTFDLTDIGLTGITGVDGTAVVSILGITNTTTAADVPTAVGQSGATVTFTSAAGTAGDTHRLSILYR